MCAFFFFFLIPSSTAAMSTKKLARLVGIFFNIYFFGTYLVRSSTDHYIFRGLRVFSLVLSCNYVGFIWCQNFLYNFFLKYIVFEDYFELNNLRVFSRCYLSKSNYLYIVDRFNFGVVEKFLQQVLQFFFLIRYQMLF